MPPLPPGVFNTCASGLVCDTSATNTCRGPGMVGDDCTRINCDATLFCDRTMTPNTCKALPTLGQMCTPSNGRCAAPYFCNFSVAPAVCAQAAQLGDACSTTVQCDPTTLYCDMTTTPAMPTCKSKLPDGATCTSSAMCLSKVCSFNGISGTCMPSTAVQCIGRM
jgi:hypothetical protein